MPYNGVGVFSRIYSWVVDAAASLDIMAQRMDTDTDDIADGLTNCITRDGQSTWLANLPAGGFKLTGLGAGSAAGDSVNYGQVFNGPTFTAPKALASPPSGDSSKLLATTEFVVNQALSGVLPGQPGTPTPNYLRTISNVPSWGDNGVTGAPIASMATINLSTATGDLVHITGTNPITAITIPDGAERTVVFDDVLPLTYNASTLILPTLANITTAPGDTAIIRGDGTAARVVSYQTSPASSADVKAGTSTIKPVTPSALLANMGFSSYFQSADQTITNAAQLTIAHGLPRIPVMIQAFLRCLTAEAGYSVGDIAPVNIGVINGSPGNPKGVSVVPTTTNLVVRYSDGGGSSNTFFLIGKVNGTAQIVTNANWAFFLRAWA